MSTEITPATGGQGGSTNNNNAAGAGQQIAAAAATPAPAAPTEWTTGLNEDLKGYVQNKGFKDPGSVLDSYRNLEKLIGVPKERLLKLPEKMDDANAMNDIYSKLGRPATPDEYKIEAAKGGDDTFAKWAKGTFHELGLSKAQAEKLVNKFGEFSQGTTKQQFEQHQAKVQQEELALKREWGGAFDQNVKVSQKAMQKFGLDSDKVDKLEMALGYAETMKLLQSMGSMVGEDSYVGSGTKGSGFSAMTPEAARNRIQALKTDTDFSARLRNGDVSAKAEWDNVHKFAYPEQS